MPLTHKVAVRELFAQCSYPMRPDAIAASDTCREHAVTVVQTAKGNLLYRCVNHQGQVSPDVTGASFDEVNYGVD